MNEDQESPVPRRAKDYAESPFPPGDSFRDELDLINAKEYVSVKIINQDDVKSYFSSGYNSDLEMLGKDVERWLKAADSEGEGIVEDKRVTVLFARVGQRAIRMARFILAKRILELCDSRGASPCTFTEADLLVRDCWTVMDEDELESIFRSGNARRIMAEWKKVLSMLHPDDSLQVQLELFKQKRDILLQ